MSEGSQIYVAPSFQALYRDTRGRWTEAVQVVAERHELCEDLAQHLTTHCQSVHIEVGADTQEVLERCLQGLLTPDAGVTKAEAQWVVTRLAELLNWPHPGLGSPAG